MSSSASRSPAAVPARARRAGLWLVGALGGVGGTAALGVSALARGLAEPVGLVTDLPPFAGADLDPPAAFVLGGHDIRAGSIARTVEELHARSNIFTPRQIEGCRGDLEAWSENVRPGVLAHAGAPVEAMADRDRVKAAATARAAVEQVKADLAEFRQRHALDQVVVVNVASTEPPFELGEEHASLKRLNAALERRDPPALPASSIYAYAALDLGLPYVNFTPSRGATVPALEELARERRTPVAGQDGKTGETLLKSVLAPMFAYRNLRVLSWVGHNIFGNRDGQVLNDPANKASKVRSKDALLAQILGYRPQSHVSIEYIESLDDWKTAWDHIHFEGFLGTKMMLQFIWQGCDSALAAPLVIDLARLTLLAQRRGESGVLRQLACFFKSPMGGVGHDFFEQFRMLGEYAAALPRRG